MGHKKMKTKKIFLTGAIVFLLLFSFQAGILGESNSDDMNNLKIKNPYRFKQSPMENIKLEKSDLSFSTDGKNKLSNLEQPLFQGEFDFQNPDIASSGQSILAAAELSEGIISADPVWKYSSDGGETWSEGIQFSWEAGYREKPCLDYCGNSEFQGYGGFMPDPSTLDFYLMHFPSLTDPAATFQDDDGWTPWQFSVAGNYEGFEDIDVAGYPHGENAPYPDFHGIFLSSCIDSTTGLDTISIIYETEDMGLQLLYMPEVDGNIGQLSTDIDLGTGNYWEAMEWSGEEWITDGVYIDYAYLEPGNPDWWSAEDAWQGFVFEGAKNPDISASNGNIYLAMEKDGGIVCAVSNDNGESFTNVSVSSSGVFSSVTANGQTATISYIRDNNLYTAISEDGGATWEESSDPINDESGSVDETAHSAVVDGSYLAWTDTRDGDKVVYFEESGASAPVIEVSSISGGFGVSAEISNVGNAEGTDIPWSINLNGGLILIGGETTGIIETLAAEESVTISSGLILGFGGVDIVVSAGGVTKSASATVILPFVIGLE